MPIRVLDTEFLTQQLQITQLLIWKLIARVTQHLHLGRKAADCKPSDHAFCGKVLPLEDKPLVVRPGRNPIALIIKTHCVCIKLAPL